MESPSHRSDAQPKPSFAELFTPKLITVLREGYGWDKLRYDIVSGLTVAIVALPLSMAIAIASGTTPDRGLYTAIIGGFIISALGGSRFQIGGPAGAFIVLVAATVQQHGLDGMLLATLIAGIILMAIGLLRLGTYVKFIPYPVTVGFTAGIAVIIFASQIKDLLGLTLHEAEPAELLEKLEVLFGALGTFNIAAAGLALLSIGIIVGLKRWRPGWPGMLVAVGLTAVIALVFRLPVETIGTRFGGIPNALPMPALPAISVEKLQAVLPNAIAFALLGAIESLLSAVVADGMTGRRHRSNCELVAQGIANIASSLFGGVPATGTIARTATNVRAGARGPVSGMLHSVFLLAFMLVAAPLASYIPLAALAGVLAVVAWNMAEKHAVWTLLRSSRGDALVLLATLLLTVFKDLTYGIVVGFALAALQFINRMAKGTEVAPGAAGPLDDVADGTTPYDPAMSSDRDVVVYRISGAFFFAAASSVSAVLDRIADQHKALVIDFSAVSLLDSTAANAIAGVVGGASRKGVTIYLSGTKPYVRQALANHGVAAPAAHFADSIAEAVTRAHEHRLVEA